MLLIFDLQKILLFISSNYVKFADKDHVMQLNVVYLL